MTGTPIKPINNAVAKCIKKVFMILIAFLVISDGSFFDICIPTVT